MGPDEGDGGQTLLQCKPVAMKAGGEAKHLCGKNLDFAGALVYQFSASVDFCSLK